MTVGSGGLSYVPSGENIDFSALTGSEDQFAARLKELNGKRQQAEKALADLELGKAAAVAHVEATRLKAAMADAKAAQEKQLEADTKAHNNRLEAAEAATRAEHARLLALANSEVEAAMRERAQTTVLLEQARTAEAKAREKAEALVEEALKRILAAESLTK